jgi:hypothetical protein
MLTYKQCRELLEDALAAMEDAIDGENIQHLAHAWIKTYTQLTAKPTGGKPLDKNLTKRYDKAKELVALGSSIGSACKHAKITRDQWYRRQSIETYGKSRLKKREY